MVYEAPEAAGRRGANRYDRAEWARAFGDLGTLLTFVLTYIAVVKIDPLDLAARLHPRHDRGRPTRH
jgi:hypothetical protein